MAANSCSMPVCLQNSLKYPAVYSPPLSHLTVVFSCKRYDVVLNEVREGVNRLILRSNELDRFPSRVIIGELADVL